MRVQYSIPWALAVESTDSGEYVFAGVSDFLTKNTHTTFDAFENAPKPPATYPRYRCMANVIHSNYSIYSIQIAILQPLAHPSVSARESVEYFAKAPLKVRLVIRDIGGHVSYATAVSQRLSSVSSNEHEQVSSNEVRGGVHCVQVGMDASAFECPLL